jgi:succinate dehydrogenase/fumarate reductase flavoprotein subunit
MGEGREFDVVVVGSGAGGLSAAIVAANEGLSVLLVEKTSRIGGCTAISGGAMWIPLNSLSAGAGHADTFERAWRYLRNTAGKAGSAAQQRALLDKGPLALEYLCRHSELRVSSRAYSPDYYPNVDGAALGGRTVDPLEFDGRQLGKRFAELRDPLREFLVLGGMMVNLVDVRHLLAVTRSFAAWKHGMRLVLRYAFDRLRGYHRGTRLLLGNALAARLFKSLLDRNVEYWLDAPALTLTREDGAEGSRVAGVRVLRNGQEEIVHARHGVIVATGGFAHDPVLRSRVFPLPDEKLSMSPEANSGDGIRMATQASATMGDTPETPSYWAPVSVLQRADGSRQVYPHLIWDRAKPGLMAVNAAGRRFVNESSSYQDFVLGMYEAHRVSPSIPAFLVCDSAFLKRWGLGLVLPGGRPHQHLVKAGYLHRADTLRALAGKLGIDAAALEETTRRFNDAAKTGNDPDFHKGATAYNRNLGDPDHKPNPCLGPVATAPFYAVRVYPADIGTAWGIRTDEDARALDADGRPVHGLYVVGADMHTLTGGAYPAAGVSLGPSITFGWAAAMHIAYRAKVHRTPADASR